MCKCGIMSCRAPCRTVICVGRGGCIMDNQKMIIRISVRSLVEFLLRSGSLDTQTGPSAETAMLEGARIHRALQKKAGDG